jgi:fatty acid desaturase
VTPRLGSALVDLATSIGAYVALTAVMVFAARVSPLIVLALAVPAAGFLIRTFIVFHDCAHGSFTRWKSANAMLGRILGVVLFMPFAWWRHKHAVHHATTGDLDKRGVGDIQTLTVDEYRARGWWGRTGYRLFRNPFVMFGLGPLWVVLIGPRLATPRMPPRLRRSVLATDLAIALLLGGLAWLVGWEALLLVLLPPLLISAPGQLVPEAPEDPPVLHREHRVPPRPPPERANPELQSPVRARGGRPRGDRPDPFAAGRPESSSAQALGPRPAAARDLPRGLAEPVSGERLTAGCYGALTVAFRRP